MCAILRVLIFLTLILPLSAWADGPVADDCGQILLVIAPDWSSPQATLQRLQRSPQGWKSVGTKIPVILGRSGCAWGLGEHTDSPAGPTKKEGDNKAPAGVFAITELWLRPGIAPPGSGGFAAQVIHPDTIAVDDPVSQSYNRILRTSTSSHPDWKSWEKMDIPDYDRVLVVAHNLAAPQPRRGSCIFIHRWEDAQTPTSGCTAMAERDLIEVIQWLRPDQKPRLVQLPQSVLQQWRQRGWIPQSSSRQSEGTVRP
jgi:L,D-peptidoglycan transpeptidase YkuD (ErfK/YbiS/YcfS/YnhG family)